VLRTLAVLPRNGSYWNGLSISSKPVPEESVLLPKRSRTMVHLHFRPLILFPSHSSSFWTDRSVPPTNHGTALDLGLYLIQIRFLSCLISQSALLVTQLDFYGVLRCGFRIQNSCCSAFPKVPEIRTLCSGGGVVSPLLFL
jgi:hypothetical protein